jgi:hypothetical protein
MMVVDGPGGWRLFFLSHAGRTAIPPSAGLFLIGLRMSFGAQVGEIDT